MGLLGPYCVFSFPGKWDRGIVGLEQLVLKEDIESMQVLTKSQASCVLKFLGKVCKHLVGKPEIGFNPYYMYMELQMDPLESILYVLFDFDV